MWTFTPDAEEFSGKAGPWLRREPVRNTIPMTVLESVLGGVYGDGNRFGWWTEDEEVRGAALQTTPHNLLLASMTPAAAEALAEAWPPDGVPGVHGEVATAETFAAGFGRRTGRRGRTGMAQRLYRLDRLSPPAGVAGRARTGTNGDRELVTRWARRFAEDAGTSPPRDAELLARRLDRGLVTFWSVDGDDVAMASATGAAGVVSRVGLVYTPPEHRRRGYGAAVTAAMTALVLERGAADAVLFTDLANPVSNSIYQAIGYQPVSDYAEIRFTSP